MNPEDPNTPILELVALALGPLLNDLVLVGGCSVGLLITDQARPPVRQTIDVDLVAQVVSIADYYNSLCPRLTDRGFQQTADEEHICRWKKNQLIVDVMPSQDILGHTTNIWYPDVISDAKRMLLPSGTEMLVVSAPIFVATKLEAFHSRGRGDYLSHDMEDIINVIDGREELFDEVAASTEQVRTYIREEIDTLLADAAFVDQLSGHFRADAASQARVPMVVSRLRKLAGI